ncbi:MAG: hypothetical protein RDU30_04855 [Desulfovibrionaceae bacterium]|nr:hypothetical protein [Desulfovibrionaceae bacterium]
MVIMPGILVIAGPNGAGKTTFAREYLPHEAGCLLFVNADLIAAGLSPFSPSLAAVRAGRFMSLYDNSVQPPKLLAVGGTHAS